MLIFKTAFFRQSGWMMVASTAGGALMFATHIFAQRMPKPEYGVFVTLLQQINLMGIPALGLQTVFAQQAAGALDEHQERQLAAAAQTVLLWTFVIWMIMAGGVFLSQPALLSTLKIGNPAALWVTVVVGLTQLCLPILMGLLQGKQNFLWLGWAAVLNGLGRFLSVALIVTLFHGYAAGAVTGVLGGFAVAVLVSAWQSRRVWLGVRSSFEWRSWLGRVLPLTLGLGASTFMLSADMIVVQSLFDQEKTGLYGAAGMIGRAMVFFIIPLTTVMFPKIVASTARAEKSNVLAQALGATALLGGLAAIGCTLFPSLPLRLIYGPSYLAIAPLVPWFAWCMLPLTLSNVLINSLLARGRFAVVPWLVLVAAGYGTALVTFSKTFVMVVQTIGVFSVMLLGVAAWFTWGPGQKGDQARS